MHVRDTPLPISATIGGNDCRGPARRTMPLLEPGLQTVALVVKGEGEWWYDGKWHALRMGWMNWRYPEERKRIRTSDGYRTIVFRFKMKRHGRLRLPRFCAWRDPQEAAVWAEEQCSLFSDHGADALRARCWYDRLLSEAQMWQESDNAFALQKERPVVILRALRIIEECALDPLFDMRVLSDALDVAERTLYQCFSEFHEQSPQQILQAHRLGHAKSLLLQQHLSIADVATASGYKNPTTFSRAFKQYTGSTPSTWRNQHALHH